MCTTLYSDTHLELTSILHIFTVLLQLKICDTLQSLRGAEVVMKLNWPLNQFYEDSRAHVLFRDIL